MGYTYYVGPELEYFYFATDKSPRSSTMPGTSTWSPPTCPPTYAARPCSPWRPWASA